jgi:hypothetical protein
MIKKVAKAITKTMDLTADPKAVYEFLANPLNWPQFAIVNLKSIKAGPNGWYEIVSKNGPGQLKMLSNKELGILDHIWKDAQATWNVYMRVVPNNEGSSIMTTFFQPPQIDAEQFSKSMQEMDLEFSKLKTILES